MTRVWGLVSVNYKLTSQLSGDPAKRNPYQITFEGGKFEYELSSEDGQSFSVSDKTWLGSAYTLVKTKTSWKEVLTNKFYMSVTDITVGTTTEIKTLLSSDVTWKDTYSLEEAAIEKSILSGATYNYFTNLYDISDLKKFSYLSLGKTEVRDYYANSKFLVPVEIFTHESDIIKLEDLVPLYDDKDLPRKLGAGSDKLWLPTSKAQWDKWFSDETFADIIDAGADHDVIFGKDAAGSVHVLTGTGVDTVTTGRFDDYVNVRTTQAASWRYDSDMGADEYDFGGWKHFGRLPPEFRSDDEFASQFSGAKTISTGAGNDVVFAGRDRDAIDTGAGNDIAFGLGADDQIAGGVGHDYLNGGSGADVLRGGDGNDYLYSGIDDDKDYLYGGSGDDVINSGVRQGRDLKGADWKNGNVLDGGTGKDYFFASNGDHVRNLEKGETVRFVIKDKQIANVIGISDENGVKFNFFEKDNPKIAARLFIDNKINPADLTLSHDYFDGFSDKREMHFVIERNIGMREAMPDPMEDLIYNVLDAIAKNIVKEGASKVFGTLLGASFKKFETALAATVGEASAKAVKEGLSGIIGDVLVTAAFNQRNNLANPDAKAPILTKWEVLGSVTGQFVELLIQKTTLGKASLFIGTNLIEGIFAALETQLASKKWRALDKAPDTLKYDIDLPSGGKIHIIDDIKDLKHFKGSATETDTVLTTQNVVSLGQNVDNLIVSVGSVSTSQVGATGTGPVTKIGNGNALANEITVSGGILKSNGMGGNDRLIGGEYHDLLNGGSGDDYLFAGTGGATMTGSTGKDTLRGGTGIDVVAYDLETGKKGIVANLHTGIVSDTFGHQDKLSSIEILRGSAFADRITGSYGRDTLIGNGGNDIIKGGSGRDVLVGGRGNDLLDGEDAGDTVDYGQETGKKGVVVNLATGIATDSFGTRDKLTSIEFVVGTKYADKITSGSGHDTLLGGSGNDKLVGGSGSDVLSGGAGADVISGGEGWDLISFEEIADKGVKFALSKTGSGRFKDPSGSIDSYTSIEGVRGSQARDHLIGHASDNTIEGLKGNDILDGGSGSDTARYNREDRFGASKGISADIEKGTVRDGFGSVDKLIRIENVIGSVFSDTILGNTARNILSGDEGNDTLRGRRGSDDLYGGFGYDILDGGKGNDKLDGAADGVEDIFIFRKGDGSDTITNFEWGADRVKIYGLKAGSLKLETIGNDVLARFGSGEDAILFVNAKGLGEYNFDFL